MSAYLGEHRAKEAGVIGERALRLARDILDLDESRDLSLPGGLAKRGRPEPPAPASGAARTRARRQRESDPPKDPGTLDFHFRLHARTPKRGRPRRPSGAEQDRLALD